MYSCIRTHIIVVIFLLPVIYGGFGCREADRKLKKINESSINISTNTDSALTNEPEIRIKPDTLEEKLISAGLINIQEIAPEILVDLKYSSTDNFMNKDVYGNLENAYLQPEVAQSLSISQNYLKSIDSSLTLLVYDAVRPRSVQQMMWDFLDIPINEKVKFVSNPKNGSIHNYGSAVDLTIAYRDGTPLDMGAKYDEIEKIAYPRLEKHFLSTGELTEKQVENRKLLRRVMKAGNFTNIGTEWWHFNRYSRPKAKSLYQIIE